MSDHTCCPRCNFRVGIGLRSLVALCGCGMVYVDVEPRGWYESEDAWRVAKGVKV